MRLFYLIIFYLILNVVKSQSFEKGIEYYKSKDFKNAIIQWKDIVNQGKAGEAVYFNLANAYCETKEYPEAIYYYNKVLRINPQTMDAKFNLKIAQSEGGIEEIDLPGFQFEQSIKNIVNVLPSSFFLLGYFILLMCGIFLWKIDTFPLSKLFSKILLSIAFLFLVCSFLQEYYRTSRNEAILMTETGLYLSPDEASESKSSLRAGEKLFIMDQIKDWSKVQTSTYEVGWINQLKYRILN